MHGYQRRLQFLSVLTINVPLILIGREVILLCGQTHNQQFRGGQDFFYLHNFKPCTEIVYIEHCMVHKTSIRSGHDFTVLISCSGLFNLLIFLA
jgi:hypothetical protein